jgi:replicative DNA helicase
MNNESPQDKSRFVRVPLGLMIPTTNQLPPHDPEAERSLLGSVMLLDDGGATLARIRRALPDRRAFYEDDNQVIWAAIVALHDAGQPLNTLTVRAHMEKSGTLANAGGTENLLRILRCMPAGLWAEHYAGIVLDRFRLREAIRLAYGILKKAFEPTTDGAAVLAEMSQGAARAASTGSSASRRMADVVAEAVAAMEAGGPNRIASGFAEFDERTGGFAPGEVVILAARPSMGKNALLAPALSAAAVPSASGATSRYRLLRSTNVPSRPLTPSTVSASQCPSVSRASASGGRWSMETRPGMRDALAPVPYCFLRALRPCLRRLNSTPPARRSALTWA